MAFTDQLGSLGDDRLFWTPSSVSALRDQADVEIMSASKDAANAWSSGRLSSSTFLPFRDFVHEWQKYSASIGTVGLLWGSTVSSIQDFRTRLIDWRKRLEAAGVQFASPTPQLPPKETSPWANAFKWIAIAGIVGAGAYVGSQALGLLPKKR